jgi:hypothetical protein
MKVPEIFFKIINPIMKFLLRSPFHGALSKSIMLITFTGRNSGRKFTTPVRYMQTDGTVRCFTAVENQWWRNLRGGAAVTLRVNGQDGSYSARAIHDDPVQIRKWLLFYLGLFPQDAAYHEIRVNKDKTLNEADLDRAVKKAILVEAIAES